MRKQMQNWIPRRNFDCDCISGGRSQKVTFAPFDLLRSHLSSRISVDQQVHSPEIARHVLGKLGQPEVPLRHNTFCAIYFDITLCAVDELDVVEWNLGILGKHGSQWMIWANRNQRGQPGVEKAEVAIIWSPCLLIIAISASLITQMLPNGTANAWNAVCNDVSTALGLRACGNSLTKSFRRGAIPALNAHAVCTVVLLLRALSRGGALGRWVGIGKCNLLQRGTGTSIRALNRQGCKDSVWGSNDGCCC